MKKSPLEFVQHGRKYIEMRNLSWLQSLGDFPGLLQSRTLSGVRKALTEDGLAEEENAGSLLLRIQGAITRFRTQDGYLIDLVIDARRNLFGIVVLVPNVDKPEQGEWKSFGRECRVHEWLAETSFRHVWNFSDQAKALMQKCLTDCSPETNA